MSRLGSVFNPLADFEAAIAGHVDIENNEVGSGFRDALERGGAVIDRKDVVTGVGQNLPPHVLSGHTIIREQYFPRQALSFGQNRRITRSYRVRWYKSIIRKPMSDRG